MSTRAKFRERMRIKCAPLFFYWAVCCPDAGRFRVSYPGGMCALAGGRPVDLHLAVLKGSGGPRSGRIAAAFMRRGGTSCTGCRYRFPRISVGATENAVMAAAAARGRELACPTAPENRRLSIFCRFLTLAMGARTSGARERRRNPQSGAYAGCIRPNFRCLPTGSWQVPICLPAPLTRGKVALEECSRRGGLEAVLGVYQKMGGQYQVKSGTLVTDSSRDRDRPVPYLETAAYPGLPTDLQSPLAAVCATLAGKQQDPGDDF